MKTPLAGFLLLLGFAASAFAQDPVNILDPVPGLALKATCTESYGESLRRNCTADDFGEVSCEEIEVTRGSGTIAITASLADLDLSSVSEDTAVSCRFGGFNHSQTLGEATTLNLARRTATFVSGFDEEIINADGDSTTRFVRTGSITYSWTQTALVISASFDLSSDFGQIGTTAFDGVPGPIDTNVEAEVGFADLKGIRKVYLTGSCVVKVVGQTDDSPGTELSTINLSGKADYELPRVAVKTPASQAKIPLDNGPTLTVTGSASDGFLLSEVQVRINGGDWANAEIAFKEIGIDEADLPIFSEQSGTWSIAMEAVPGPNLLEARAVDGDGNLSLLAPRVIHYQVPAQLTVELSPPGTGRVSSGFLGTSSRLEGVTYTVTASPSSGMVFDGWETSEGQTFVTPTLKFVMRQDLILTAKFAPNPYSSAPGLTGSFFGVIRPNPDANEPAGLSHENTGWIDLKISTAGACSGNLIFAGNTYLPFRGVFTGGGLAQIDVTRRGSPSIRVNMQINTSSGGEEGVTGTLSDYDCVFGARKPAFSRSEPYTGPNQFTLAIPHPGGIDTAPTPQGSGYATFTVSSTGQASFSFVLADETLVTLSAPLTEAEGFPIPIYRALYRTNTGCIQASILLESTSGPEGTFFWSRPADSRNADYPAGFAFQSGLQIAPFTYTPGELIVSALVPGDPLTLQLTDGGLMDPVSATFTMNDPVNVPVFDTPVPLGLTLSFLPRRGRPTGVFTGTYLHPDTGRVLSIKGVALQDHIGAGFFRGAPGEGHGKISIMEP